MRATTQQQQAGVPSAAASRPGARSGRVRRGLSIGVLTLLPLVTVAQSVDLVVVDVVAVAKGYRTSQLTGREVINERNDEIGKIDDFIIGQDKVLFTVLQVGGFLGIGSYLVAVPYKSLDLDSRKGKVVLKGATKEELQKLPEFKYSKPS
jgi:sporulation protein YlmC with PRC-barrel domain